MMCMAGGLSCCKSVPVEVGWIVLTSLMQRLLGICKYLGDHLFLLRGPVQHLSTSLERCKILLSFVVGFVLDEKFFPCCNLLYTDGRVVYSWTSYLLIYPMQCASPSMQQFVEFWTVLVKLPTFLAWLCVCNIIKCVWCESLISSLIYILSHVIQFCCPVKTYYMTTN